MKLGKLGFEIMYEIVNTDFSLQSTVSKTYTITERYPAYKKVKYSKMTGKWHTGTNNSRPS